MIAQVIFFIAIGLFLVLLLRRVRVLQTFPQRFLPWVKSLFGAVQKGAEGLQARTQQLRHRPAAQSRQEAPPSTQNAGANQFWQEDFPDNKPELNSHFEEGDALLKSGQHAEAEQFFLKAAAANPNDAKVYAKLGLIYLNSKNYSDAIEALKMAAKIDKYNPSRHYNLALAYFGNKDLQHAIVSAREAISLDPVTGKYRQFLDELLKGGGKVKLP